MGMRTKKEIEKMLKDIKNSLINGEAVLLYPPKNHSSFEPPDVFLPLAEQQKGAIRTLKWVLKENIWER